jgi:molybdenum cofactor cytidylyltransferase
MISAIVLAIGKAEGTSPPGFLRPRRGKPALQWVLEEAILSAADEVICVADNLALARPQISLVDEKLFWLVDYGADRGKSHPMIAGLWTVAAQSSGVLFLSGDGPSVPKELIDALIALFERSGAWIVAPSFHGEPGKPLLFRRETFPELLKLSGDREGLELIDKYRAKTALIEWTENVPFASARRPTVSAPD